MISPAHATPFLDKTYKFSCKASFGTLSQESVNKLFTDGRRASGFLEKQLENWFPELSFIDGKGYDHIDSNGIKYDAKCFTKLGAKFCASKYIGVGRKLNIQEHLEHSCKIIYIFCDIVDFPIVYVIFKKGSDLTHYKRGFIPFKDRNLLFFDKGQCIIEL